MRNYNAIYLVFLMALITSFGFFSCDKSDQELSDIIHYKVERINEHNFSSEGWKEQQVNIASNVTSFLDFSDHIEIVCGPDNTTDPRLKQGAVTMNLPTSADPTLRRIRLRRGGYSGTFLADLTELKYSTYVVQNAPTNMVIQIDVNGDDTKDFNIFYEPRENNNGNTLELNRWQQWNALAGNWHVEVATVPIPQTLTQACTIAQIVAAFPNARIIDTEPMGHNGEGVRFTIGGTPASLFANTISYFDALIIGTRNERHSTLFDFTCNRRK
jgi:hypothetical protein